MPTGMVGVVTENGRNTGRELFKRKRLSGQALPITMEKVETGVTEARIAGK